MENRSIPATTMARLRGGARVSHSDGVGTTLRLILLVVAAFQVFNLCGVSGGHRKLYDSMIEIAAVPDSANAAIISSRKNFDDHSTLTQGQIETPQGHGIGHLTQPHSVHERGHAISLIDLVNTVPDNDCGRLMHMINDTILPEHRESLAQPPLPRRNNYHDVHQVIPKIVHITTRTRCAPQPFHDVVDQWRFANHSVLVHNDAAMERLLARFWPEFPHLQDALQCSISGAARADLWRALVMWEYGGIYTDIDNAPNEFRSIDSIVAIANATNIDLHGDVPQAFFLVERGKFLSQYFFAAVPRHPVMYLLVQATLFRLMQLTNVGTQYVPVVTGPGALKQAFKDFMNAQGPNPPYTFPQGMPVPYHNPTAGHYVGLDNWTVTVLGDNYHANRIVQRDVIPSKGKLYRTMNMTHFSRARVAPELHNVSCWQQMYRSYRQS